MKIKTSALCFLALLGISLFTSPDAFSGTVTGTITTATSGPIINGTLTLTPTQAFVVTGTATVVSSAVACYTDASGNVVGEPNPLVAPVVTPNTGSGTLAAGTYFTRFAYQDATGTTFYSFETTTILTSTGSLIVTAPVKQPSGATGFKVFISTSSSTETLQGTITGTPGTWASYTQSVPLVSGSALPGSNTTACKPYFSDEGIPGFSYLVGLSNSSGSNVSGFPQKWRLFGGSAGTVNLSLGMPLSDGVVVYPQPIVTTPAFNATQSINGPLNLNGFPLTATGITNAGNETIAGGFSVAKYTRDCRSDGTIDTTGTADSSTVINTCVANAVANNQGAVTIPCGLIKANSVINLTNLANGIDFSGCGGTAVFNAGSTNIPSNVGNVTVFLGNTGNMVIDATGSSSVSFHDFNIATQSANATFTNPSIVGIVYGRDNGGSGGGSANPFCFSQFNKLYNVYIAMHHAQTVNSNNGTIAVYNVNAEHWKILAQTRFEADRTMMFMTSNGVGVSSPYQTIQTGCPASMTLVSVDHNSSLGSGTSGLSMILSQASEINFTNQHTQAGVSSNSPAFELSGPAGASGVHIDGRCENEQATVNSANGVCIQFKGTANDVHVTLGTSALTGSTGAWIGTDANGYTISDSDFRIETTDGGSTLPLLSASTVTLKNTKLFLSNSTSPLSAATWTCQGCTVEAPNHTNANVSFSGTSTYTIRDSTGGSFVWNAGGTSTFPTTTGKLLQTSGAQVWGFTCTGTATAGTTLTINNAGVTTCTTVGTNPTSVAPVSGTLSNLQVKCGTGGVNASSGVFTVIANLGGTSLACTTGTATTCSDTTHTAAISAGQQLQLRFTTQAAETLANCTGSFVQN
jgi:hypothetical protein